MPAAPKPVNEAQRLLAIEELNVLDTPPEEAFDRITRLACQLFQVPIAAVSIVAGDRQFFKSIQGLDARETPREQAFCGYTILGDGVLFTEDAARDARFQDNPLVTGDPGIRFYAGFPLRLPGGLCIGSLCLIDREPRMLRSDEANLLKELAGVVVETLIARRAAADAIAAARVKSTFLASIGHEIRTPMTAILGYSEIITDPSFTAAERDEMLAGIQRNGRHLIRLINDLLDFAGAESGRLPIRREPASPAQVTREIIAALTPRARENGVTLRPRIEVPDDLRITTDLTRLRQVLLNITSVAIGLAQSGCVDMHTRMMPGDGRALLVTTISIPGGRISPEDVDRFFEPFSDRADAPGRGGVGLGLALSRRISRLLGGDLELVTSPGGAAFRITLRADPTTTSTASTGAAPGTQPPLRIAG